MIQRVYDNCQEANINISPSSMEGKILAPLKFDIFVVTDDDEIEKHLNGATCRVDDPVNTGSERIYLAYKRFFLNKGYDLLVNMQGDEPLLKGSELRRLCQLHLSNSAEIATLIRKRDTLDQDFTNKNVVKVIYSPQTELCHYFSRSPIPYFVDDKSSYEWYQHIGIYSYKIDALERFSNSLPGHYEKRESLEQLRAIEMGMSILGIKTDLKLIGVDTPEDIEKIERVLAND